MAEFLNTNFYAFDHALIMFFQNFNCDFMTGLAKTFTFLGEKGLIYIIISVILMLFSKTRRVGVALFGAVCFATLFSTFTLKNIVARERPFIQSAEYKSIYDSLGAKEVGYSFPSGHATCITAVATALFITSDKKWSFVGFFGVLIMGISRIYLVAHFPTDVIAGIIIGAISGFASVGVTKLIYYILNKYPHIKLYKFILNFDIRSLFKRKEVKTEKTETVENEQTRNK